MFQRRSGPTNTPPSLEACISFVKKEVVAKFLYFGHGISETLRERNTESSARCADGFKGDCKIIIGTGIGDELVAFKYDTPLVLC